ncbi:MAG: hypothetical protein Q9218_004833 [Villophora microphyllina]
MPPTMLLRRSAVALSRRAVLTPISCRTLTSSVVRRQQQDKPDPSKDIKTNPEGKHHRLDPIPGQTADMIPFDDVKSDKDLIGPGAAPGTIPTDLEQATGLERFEILGKMQGIDVFDMKPLDASRLGMNSPPPHPFLSTNACERAKRRRNNVAMTTITIQYMHGFLLSREGDDAQEIEYI